MSLTKIEQETIILFNEGESDAEVYTHNVKLKNKLSKMAKKCPEHYHLKLKNPFGGVTYTLPKKALVIIFKDVPSEEERLKRKEVTNQYLGRYQFGKKDGETATNEPNASNTPTE